MSLASDTGCWRRTRHNAAEALRRLTGVVFVKEVSAHFGADINRFKTGYDCVSCLVGVAMSFFAFGLRHFEGVKWGTILCALINGYVIGRFSAFYEKHWTFCDRFPWRKYFAPDAAAQTSAE